MAWEVKEIWILKSDGRFNFNNFYQDKEVYCGLMFILFLSLILKPELPLSKIFNLNTERIFTRLLNTPEDFYT